MAVRTVMSATVVVAVASALAISAARTHPGGTDEAGCHVCSSNCEKWGEREGERHCHGGGESSSETESSGDESEADLEIEEGDRAYVQKVLDGDTLQVRVLSDGARELRIRILGIDCPESHENPKCRREGAEGGATCAEQIPDGLRASRRAAELVKGEVVGLESGTGGGEFERGGYGRLLAYVRLSDGRDLGEVLIREDHCSDYGDEYPHPRHDRYERAEAES